MVIKVFVVMNDDLENIFPWMNERACNWKKIHNEVLNDLQSSPKIFRLIKSRRINLQWHVACRLTGESCTVSRRRKQREMFRLGDSSLDETMLLRRIFRK